MTASKAIRPSAPIILLLMSLALLQHHMVRSQNMVKVEYFIDTDPGFDKANPLPITPDPMVQDITYPIDISTLSYGFHTFFLRGKSNSGIWSLTNRFSFVKMRGDRPITETEYFFDTDPGFGKGTPLALNPANTIADFVAQVNITNLTPGAHRLHIRSKEGNDNWSLTNYYDLTITSSDPAPLINVNSITDLSPCAGTSFKMAYHATGNHVIPNTFTVQLSGPTGDFSDPITIGSVVDTADRVVTCHLPKTLAYGTNYRIRVNSSNVAVTGIPNASPITIRPAPYLGNDTTVFIQCSTDSFDLTTIYNLAGLSTQWSLNDPTRSTKGIYQLIVTNSYGCRDTVLITVKQDVALWTGSAGSNWHDPANWTTGKVPSAITHVIIPLNATQPCIVSNADATISSLQVRNAGMFRVLNDRKVTITGRCDPLPVQPD